MHRPISMPMNLSVVAVVALLASCGNQFDPAVLDDPDVIAGMGAPVTRVHGAQLSDTQADLAPSLSNPEIPENFTPDEDIVFTNPDNPEESLPELSSILTDQTARKGPWEKSIQIAKRRSMREGKSLLIWFTNSQRSPMCKAMNEELFSLPEFNAWAEENLIRLRVDEGEDINDDDLTLSEKETLRSDLRNYVKRLKQQYKVLGYPSLVLLSPNGQKKTSVRGYSRGEAEYTWGLIRQGVVASQHSYQAWRASLEAKGYRQWHDRKGRGVLAKLTSYRNGVLTLIEPDGSRSKTHESKLSTGDREWIYEQKRRRAR